ncbi:MAG: MurR/RpiR family transcriptional regulator [Lachnospiraceae bacterium]|nr:MurR/RpiR family transcriptional regulator [Lachnospiraceae bacterium]
MQGNNYMVFRNKLKRAYEKMTAAERRIADYMLESPERVLEATAVPISEATDTSTATVIRFSRTCGFSGLTDLKLSLKREYEITGDSEDSGQNIGNFSIQVIKEKVMAYHNLAINTVLSRYNEETYAYGVESVLNAKRILVMGEGGSRSSAFCMYDVLMQLGLPVQISIDGVYEMMQIGNMEQGDVVIALTYTGRLQNTIDSLRLAKERRITTMGFVGELESPIIPYVDILLNTNMVQEREMRTSMSVRVSEMAVIEIFYAALSSCIGKQVEGSGKYNQFVELRRTKMEI